MRTCRAISEQVTRASRWGATCLALAAGLAAGACGGDGAAVGFDDAADAGEAETGHSQWIVSPTISRISATTI